MSDKSGYSVALLGDTHFDAEPESVYHAHYDGSDKHAAIHRAEFRRNGKMWRGPCRDMLAASGTVSRELKTDMVLQLGDLIQGDCGNPVIHRKMLDDCVAMFRGAYPSGLPFLTVLGNHDVRGKGARKAYNGFVGDFVSEMAGCAFRYPVASFRRGDDLWVFCDFEMKDLRPLISVLENEEKGRYTFLVTHGPFTAQDTRFFRWRLAGRKHCEKLRPKLYSILSRRKAVVLSGHTHRVCFFRHENDMGGFTEFTASSVLESPDQATAVPFKEGVDQYGTDILSRSKGHVLKDLESELGFFRPGLKEYYMSRGQGHFRMDIGASGVTMSFYPGAQTVPVRKFKLA